MSLGARYILTYIEPCVYYYNTSANFDSSFFYICVFCSDSVSG